MYPYIWILALSLIHIFEYKANQVNTQVNGDEFSEGDVYVIGNPILSDCLFLKVNIDDIKNIEDDLKQNSGEELINGHFIYWKGEGIDYVTHSTICLLYTSRCV